MYTQKRFSSTDSASIASTDALRPASQPVRNVAAVAVSGDTETEVAGGIDRARVVHASGPVEVLHTLAAGFTKQLLETVAGCSARHAVLDHLVDLGLRARVLHVRAVVAGAFALVGLEQARVGVRVAGCRGARAAVGLLHHDHEDESFVDAGGGCDVFDRRLDVRELLVGVVGLAEGVGARGLHNALIDLPEIVEREPPVFARPAG